MGLVICLGVILVPLRHLHPPPPQTSIPPCLPVSNHPSPALNACAVASLSSRYPCPPLLTSIKPPVSRSESLSRRSAVLQVASHDARPSCQQQPGLAVRQWAGQCLGVDDTDFSSGCGQADGAAHILQGEGGALRVATALSWQASLPQPFPALLAT